jgi:Subtilase family
MVHAFPARLWRDAMIALLAGCILGCSEHSLVSPLHGSPLTTTADSAVARGYATGCAQFAIGLQSDRHSVTIASIPSQSCASPVQPTLSAGHTPTYDSVAGVVHVWVAIANGGKSDLTMPARLLGAIARQATAFSPTAIGSGCVASACVTFANADTQSGVGPIWRYDTLLAASGSPQVLATGAQSAAREIDVVVRGHPQPWRVTFDVRAQEGSVVPALPPDNRPSWIFASPAYNRGMAATGIVTVQFKSGTSQADRQLTIDLISGRVVGGTRFQSGGSGGNYYVSVPNDSTEAQLKARVLQLKSLPMVAMAGLVHRVKGAYLDPKDGTGWKTWIVNRHKFGFEANWYLEADNAPFAWGCSSGDTTAHVGMVDYNYDDTEIEPNVVYGASLLGSTSDSLHHGTAVANVITATGNNGTGMTGMMWQSSLLLATPTGGANDMEGAGIAIDSLAKHGANIVNISLEFSNDTTTDSASVIADFYEYVSPHLKDITIDGYTMPLLVIAAGNGGLVSDSTGGTRVVYSGFPIARDSFPAIVVDRVPLRQPCGHLCTW